MTRIPDERLSEKVFYGELKVRKRSKDGQMKRFKDTLKVSLKDFNILPPESWEQIAQDRGKCIVSSEREQMTTKQRSQLMRLWYLSHRRPSKAQASLRIRALARAFAVRIHKVWK